MCEGNWLSALLSILRDLPTFTLNVNANEVDINPLYQLLRLCPNPGRWQLTTHSYNALNRDNPAGQPLRSARRLILKSTALICYNCHC